MLSTRAELRKQPAEMGRHADKEWRSVHSAPRRVRIRFLEVHHIQTTGSLLIRHAESATRRLMLFPACRGR